MGHNVSFPFSKDSIHNKTHTAHRKGAPCVFLNLCFLCNLFLFHQPLVGQKISDKQNTGQSQSAANTGIEERNELVGEYAGSPESDAAAHHAGHNHICLQIKEMPERTTAFITDNPFRMLFAHFTEHGAEHAKHADRQQIQVPLGVNRAIGQYAQSGYIKSGKQPHNAGNQQQCSFVDAKKEYFSFFHSVCFFKYSSAFSQIL